MIRRFAVPAIALLALAACSKPATDAGTDNLATAQANSTEVAPTVETTGAPAGVGSYGPGLVATPVFIEQAGQSDMFEIAASRLALTQAKSPEIKAFAKDMIAAHEATTAELKSIVGKDHLPALPATLDAKHQRMIDDLKKADAAKFDKDYLDQQTSAHREALGLMDSYATHGENAALKAFADKTKPKIQEHLAMSSKLDHSGADDTAKTAG